MTVKNLMPTKKKLEVLVLAALSLTMSYCSTASKYDFSDYTIKQDGLKQEIIKRYKEQDEYKDFGKYLSAIDYDKKQNLTYTKLAKTMLNNHNNK